MKINFKNLTKSEIAEIINGCHFTHKERKIFDLRCNGYTLDEIAEKMDKSTSTVDRLSASVMRKIKALKE